MECLDYKTYIERRMSALGLVMPISLFDNFDQMVARLSQIALISSLNPGASAAVVLGRAGLLPALGALSAAAGVFYVSAFATSLFLAAADGQYCRNINKLNSHRFISWMRFQGIYDVQEIEAELIKSPELLVA